MLDESADRRLSKVLEPLGHDVTAVSVEYPAGISDRDVLANATTELRIVITNDHDFGELLVRYGLDHAGVVLFRLSDETLDLKTRRLKALLAEHADVLASALVVVTDVLVRIRRRQ